MIQKTFLKALSIVLVTIAIAISAAVVSQDSEPDKPVHGGLMPMSDDQMDEQLKHMSRNWTDVYIPQLLEIIGTINNEKVQQKIYKTLEKHTNKHFKNTNDWYYWLWNKPENISPDYINVKADIYRWIDPAFESYFRDRQGLARIRLDEIRWSGVAQDGVPPLRNPNMIGAEEASYLDDDNIVFGIEINGDVRAYPKRILAWHEMFVDTVGGVEITGVYCTLCEAVIPYKTEFDGVRHQLGTSGFLYRSNKLMYDKATQSLWSTLTGKPVLGPLVDKNIALEHLSVVTTTWGEWKRRHPNTQVLSLETGHKRDYGEGVAHKSYFANQKLRFNTPFKDSRLENKREVVALRFMADPDQQLAINTRFLNKNPLYRTRLGQQEVLVLTDTSGANRVYDPQDIEFLYYDGDSTVVDAEGKQWQLNEGYLLLEGGDVRLPRLPHFRAFWFGWHAAYPETQLIR